MGKVSVIMFDREIPNGDVEALRQRFEAGWGATVREFGLDVEKE